jgi:hypothetical protein
MRRPWTWYLFVLVFIIVTFPFLDSFCKKQTDGFTLLGIQSSRPYNPKWDVHPLSSAELKEAADALSQKFHYLSCGQQSYVFLSEDKQYVIKFFKQKIYDLPLFDSIPHSWLTRSQQKKIAKKRDKLHRDFTSYKLAFDELKDETALILVHLNKTDFLQKKLCIVDKLHIEHQIDLDNIEFILQKKAELVCPRLDRLVKEGKIAQARESLSSLLQLLLTRYKKGIFDSDPDFDKNFGFINDHPVQIDIGRFSKKQYVSSHHLAKNASYITNRRKRNKVLYYSRKEDPPCINERFPKWLKEHHPDLAIFFEAKFQELADNHAFQYP